MCMYVCVCTFICSVVLQYFRSCAAVPPPPMTSSSMYRTLQPIIPQPPLHQTNCRATLERSTPPTSFQKSVRPPTAVTPTSQKLPMRVITDKNSSNIGRQQLQQQPCSTNKTASNGTDKVISTSSNIRHLTSDSRSSLDVLPPNRQLKDQPVISLSLTSQPFPETSIRRQINPDQQTASVSKFANNVDINSNIITDLSRQENSKQQDENEELVVLQSVTTGEHQIGIDVGSSAWDTVQRTESGPRSPADSGWMSDVSVTAGSNSSNEEGEGNFPSSSSPLHIDAEDGDDTVDKMRGDDDHKSSRESHVKKDGELSSNGDATSSLRKPTRFADELSEFHVAECSSGAVESVEGGGQSGGEGDDEDSLSSLSINTSDAEKPAQNETTTSIRSTTDHAHGNTMRQVQGRVMKNIPVRFQRLLEAEVQRVAALRRRVEGQPIYATAAVNMPPDAVFAQNCVMPGCSNITNEPMQMSSLMSAPANWGGNANVYSHMSSAPTMPVPPPGYQLQYNSDQVSYGTMPGSYFILGAPPSTGSIQPPAGEPSAIGSQSTSMQAPAPFMQPQAVAAYQPTGACYDGSFFQPCYESYPSGIPTYVVYVDSITPTMVGNQPSNFRSASSYDYRMVAPPSSNVGMVSSSNTGNTGGCHSSMYGASSIPYDTTPLLVVSTSGNTVIHTTPHFAVDPVHGEAVPATTNKLLPQSLPTQVPAV